MCPYVNISPSLPVLYYLCQAISRHSSVNKYSTIKHMQFQMFDFANKMNSEIGVEWMHRPISPD